MMISTRGRYALRTMIDLAEQTNNSFIPLRDIAARQHISLKYLEGIIVQLSKAQLVEGQQGKGGGYRLMRSPADITVWEILQKTEGNLAPVACLTAGAEPCAQAADCKTLPLWQNLNRVIETYLAAVTLEQVRTGSIPM